MSILNKIKLKMHELDEKRYSAKEKGLLERIERAKQRKIKVDRLNALEKELSGYLPKERAKSKQVGFAEGLLRNSYLNMESGNKKKVRNFFQ